MHHKNVAGFVILFLLLLVAWSASAEATAGYWGTCTWEITTEGVLVIGPGTGVDTNEHSPWQSSTGIVY